MDARVRGKSHLLYNSAVPDLQGVAKKRLEWDLNDWKWDGDLFKASSVNNGSASASKNNELENELGKRELEKRRRDVIVEDDNLVSEDASLNLKLGGQNYPIMDEDAKTGKKNKLIGTGLNRPVCQVEDCRADLSNAKDYHRRHKVCELHSKASKALVGNLMQRFCQQCSRFHVVEEFDEGKRSCRKRLAGHNKRRRKTHPENPVNESSLNDEKANTSDQAKDQDLISHLLKNLANPAGMPSGQNITGLLQNSENLVTAEITALTPEKDPDLTRNNSITAGPSTSASKKDDNNTSKYITRHLDQCGVNETHGRVKRMMCNDIDLNNAYDGSQDSAWNLENSPAPLDTNKGSITCPILINPDFGKKSQSQPSRNSESTSSLSPSSSNGEAQSRTDRIVFKLFGKDPNDLPVALRTQILDWLSHSPSDIESYIRPGCIVLTIYLHLEKPQWKQICLDLGSSLSRLLDASSDPFWKSGWVYARVQHCVSFIYNGQVVLNTPLPLESNRSCKILSIKPIAVTLSERTHFVAKGFNICRPTSRLLCALEGEYLIQQNSSDLIYGTDTINDHEKLETLSFPCSIPSKIGRGFIEIEDYGLYSSFFPFIVAEKEVCSEICLLEEAIDAADKSPKNSEKIEAKNQALDFIHEMGWLLHRNCSKSRLGHLDPNSDLFPLKRYRWLLEFSMDRDWCAVVKKLLNILFNGMVDTRNYSSIELALPDMFLLHRAVHRNSTSMVELLIKFVPNNPTGSFIFKPDAVAPGGLTPLHIAASRDGCENILDALTDDPGFVGIQAWKTCNDNSGLTPYDYASLRGFYSYIHLIERKINKKQENAHTVDIDIPTIKSSKIVGMEIEEKMGMNRLKQDCKLCKEKVVYGQRRTSMAYRPAVLSMVAIAAICVCVALLFKSSPEVLFVFRPFRWELLDYGSS